MKNLNVINGGVMNREEGLVMENLTVVELKEIAKNEGIKGYSKMRKAELIKELDLVKESKNGNPVATAFVNAKKEAEKKAFENKKNAANARKAARIEKHEKRVALNKLEREMLLERPTMGIPVKKPVNVTVATEKIYNEIVGTNEIVVVNKDYRELALKAAKCNIDTKHLEDKAMLDMLIAEKEEKTQIFNALVEEVNELVKNKQEEKDLTEGRISEIGRRAILLRKAKKINKLNFKLFDLLKNQKFDASLSEKMIDVLIATEKYLAPAIKKDSKDLETLYIRQISVTATEKGLDFDTVVQPSQESALLRAIDDINGLKKLPFADKIMTGEKLGTTDVATISIDNELLSETNAPYLKKLFLTFEECYNNKENICMVIDNAGVAKTIISKPENVELKEDETLLVYDILGVTASGLRSLSILLMSVGTKEYGKDLVEKDVRQKALDKSLANAYSMSYTDAKGYIDQKNFTGLFKSLNRITMGASPSKKLYDVETYVVFENIAQNAGYYDENGKFVSCKDTRDGNIILNAVNFYKYMKEKGYKISLNECVGVCKQIRGAALKCSGLYMDKKNTKFLSKYLIEDGVKVDYIVVKGQRYKSFDDLTEENKEYFYNNVEMVADRNSMKLGKHDNKFNLVELKTAYESESTTNTVTNIALLIANSDAAMNLLSTKGKEEILKTFEGLGIKFEKTDRGLAVCDIDFDALEKLNNESLFADYLYKTCPQCVEILPQVFASLINTRVKSLANKLLSLKFDSFDSVYKVIQSDITVLFGQRVLKDNEIYSNEFQDVDRVSGVRHPMSYWGAVTTFKCLTKAEVLKRIEALNVSGEVKDFIKDYFLNTVGYAIIPASHYLMEKHDGMDFDIDAMQFFKNKDVVDLLATLKEEGTLIERENVGDKSVYGWCAKDEAVAKLQKGKEFKTVIEVEKENKPAKNNTGLEVSDEFAPVSNKSIFTTEFHNIASAIFKYCSNPIDPVGKISTAFYNNAMLYLHMINPNVPVEEKEVIASMLSSYYGTCGKKTYETKIQKKETDKATQYVLYKDVCFDILYGYKDSDGSVLSTTVFLLDCCICNRYPGETSIDSAKNGYYTKNYFNHARLVKALGSDKNILMNLESDSEDVKKLFKARGCKNIFGVKLISFENKPNVYTYSSATKEQKDEVSVAVQSREFNKQFGFKDNLAIIRETLTKFANNSVVSVMGKIENMIQNVNAEKKRNDILINFKNKHGKNADNIMNSVNSIARIYTSLSITLENKIVVDKEKDTYAKSFLKNNALASIKNTSALMFGCSVGKLTKEELGEAVVAALIRKFNTSIKEEKIEAVGPSYFLVFGEEILCFFRKYFDNDNIGKIFEKLSSAVKDNKKVKLESLVGQTIAVEHGIAKVEETIVFAKNKKATIEGTVVEVDGRYYVESTKEFVQKDSDMGVFMNVYNIDHAVNLDEIKSFHIVNSTKHSRIIAKVSATVDAVLDTLVGSYVEFEDGKFANDDCSLALDCDKTLAGTIVKIDNEFYLQDEEKMYSKCIGGVKHNGESVHYIASMFIPKNEQFETVLKDSLKDGNIRIFTNDNEYGVLSIKSEELSEILDDIDNNKTVDLQKTENLQEEQLPELPGLEGFAALA